MALIVNDTRPSMQFQDCIHLLQSQHLTILLLELISVLYCVRLTYLSPSQLTEFC